MNESINVVCPQCESIVRLPQERLDDGARCPKCHSALFDGQTIALTTSNFDRYIAKTELPGSRLLGTVVWPLPGNGTAL